MIGGIISIFGTPQSNPGAVAANFFKSSATTDATNFLMSWPAQGINNFLQNWGSDQALNKQYGSNYAQSSLGVPQGGRPFWGYFWGGMLSNLSTLVPGLLTLPIKSIGAIFVANQGTFRNSFIAAPWSTDNNARFQLRPAVAVSAPRVSGPQFATVVGIKGKDNSTGDIFADSFGRVRVRFPWDPGPRSGNGTSQQTGDPWTSDTNTCWVRVADAWAGEKLGTQFLPRVGQEVPVDFVNGDPERPVIVGRMYNANNGTANQPFPPASQAYRINNDYLLDPSGTTTTSAPGPSSLMKRSGIKTRSTPLRSGDGDRFHLLRFDDDRDHEQLLLRSQGRMDVTVMGTYYDSTHGSYNLTIGGQDPKTLKCGGDLTTKVFKNYDLTVGKDDDADPPGSMRTTVSQNYELTVGTAPTLGNTFFDLKKDWVVNVGGGFTVNALATAGPPPINGSIVLNAMNDITLMVGPNMIVLNTAGIFMVAPSINLAGPVFELLPLMAVPPNPPPPTGVGIPLVLVKVPVKTPTGADPGEELTALLK